MIMMSFRVFLSCLILYFIQTSVFAQSFPVTTSSEKARQIFLEYGWDNAFNFQDKQHLETMDRLISMDSTFALAYLHRGGYSPLHIRKEYFELAKENKKNITEDEQKLVDAFYAFMWDYDQLKAVKILEELAEKYPKQPHFPAYIGIRYRNLGEFAKAIPFLEEAIQRDPDFAPAYQLLGLMYLGLKQFDLAEKYFKIYKQKEPGFWRGNYNLGTLYLQQDKLSEANEHYLMAIAMDPSAEARDIIGYNYLLKGQIERAKELFEENLARHPNDPNSYSSMGDWFFEQQEFNEAAEWYKKALEYDPLNTAARDYHNNMVDAYIRHAKQSFKAAFQNQELEQLAQLFTFNATLITSTGKTIQGPSDIVAYFKVHLDRGIHGINLTSKNVIGSIDQFYATETGRFAFISKDTAETKGHYTTIWRNTSDGWKINNVMFLNQLEE